MSDEKSCVNCTCLLRNYRTAPCESYCAHRIALSGLTGDSGRIANAGIPKDYRDLTLATSPAREGQSELYTTLERYIATFGKGDVKSLYLWSETPGTGKTTTASALLIEWIIRDYLNAVKDGKTPKQTPGVFLDVNEFQTQYNLATMTKDDAAMERIGKRIKRVQRADFAVLDDIGVRAASEAFRSYVHAIINHRVANGLPTVYTSNLPIKEMAEVFDERLYDRMRDQCGVISFKGESKRGRR